MSLTFTMICDFYKINATYTFLIGNWLISMYFLWI